MSTIVPDWVSDTLLEEFKDAPSEVQEEFPVPV